MMDIKEILETTDDLMRREGFFFGENAICNVDNVTFEVKFNCRSFKAEITAYNKLGQKFEYDLDLGGSRHQENVNGFDYFKNTLACAFVRICGAITFAKADLLRKMPAGSACLALASDHPLEQIFNAAKCQLTVEKVADILCQKWSCAFLIAEAKRILDEVTGNRIYQDFEDRALEAMGLIAIAILSKKEKTKC